jgi:hypothetical protein
VCPYCGQEQAAREALPWSATQREAEMVNQPIQPRRPPREWARYRHIEPLNEESLTAIAQYATEATGHNLDPNQLSLGREIRQLALVAAVDTDRRMAAGRTSCRDRNWPGKYGQCFDGGFDTFNGQPTRSKRDTLGHDSDSLSVCCSRSR